MNNLKNSEEISEFEVKVKKLKLLKDNNMLSEAEYAVLKDKLLKEYMNNK